MSSASLYTFAYLLMNVLQLTMLYSAFHLVFPAKISPRLYYPLILLINTALCLLSFYVLDTNTLLRIALMLGCLVCFVFFLHRGKALRKLISILLLFGTVPVTELTGYLLAPELSRLIQARELCRPEFLLYYVMFLLVQGIYLYLMVYALRVLDKRNKNRLSDLDRLCYVLFPVNQLVLLEAWFRNTVFRAPEDHVTAGTFLIIAASLVLSILTDVLLFHLINRTAENAELRTRNRLMEAQAADRVEYYRILAQSYSDMRQLRHDIANHICTIHAMLRSGEKEAAEEYVGALERTPAARSLLSDCQNTVVDAFLREQTESLSARSIPLSADIHLPPSCFVNDIDLITILGNLLDNAADACRQVPEPYIRLKVELADGFLHIETENPFRPEGRAKKARRIAYMERGVGTGILNSLAEKYGGSFTVRTGDFGYNSILVLKEPTYDQHLPV